MFPPHVWLHPVTTAALLGLLEQRTVHSDGTSRSQKRCTGSEPCVTPVRPPSASIAMAAHASGGVSRNVRGNGGLRKRSFFHRWLINTTSLCCTIDV